MRSSKTVVDKSELQNALLIRIKYEVLGTSLRYMEISKVVGVFVIGTLLALSLAFASITVTRMSHVKHQEGRTWGSWTFNSCGVQSSVNVYTASIQTQAVYGVVTSQANVTTFSSGLSNEISPVTASLKYLYVISSNNIVYTVFSWHGRLETHYFSLYLENATVVAPYGLWVTHSWVDTVEEDRMVVFTSTYPNSTLVVNLVFPGSSNVTAFSVPGYLELENYTVSIDNGEAMMSFVYKVGSENNVLIILPFLFENTPLYYVIYVK